MKRSAVMLALAAMIAAAALPVVAQMVGLVTVKGKATGLQGEPLSGTQGFVVQLVNNDNGRKFTGSPSTLGEYQIAGVPQGNYTVSLLKGPNVVWSNTRVQVEPDNNNFSTVDIPLAKIAAEQAAGGGKLSEEQQKKIEEIKKKNEEIESYNTKVRAVKPLLEQADAAQKAGKMDEAIADLTQASQAAGPQPEFAVVWSRLGDAYLKAKRPADAVPPLQKAVEMKPSDTAVRLMYGDALLKSGKPDDAAKEFQTAAQANDANAALAYYDLGAALTTAAYKRSSEAERNKAIDDANAAFDQAIAKKPDYADAYYQKAVNLFGKATTDKTGKVKAPEGTAEALNKYLELQPNGAHAEEAKQLLAGLGEQVQTTYKKGKK